MKATAPLCISGASGFVGRHLLHHLMLKEGSAIRCLARDPRNLIGLPPGIEVPTGDIRDEAALRRWLKPGAVVINLAFDRNAPLADNVAAAITLARACNHAQVKRLVHLSTATVVGRNPANMIDESSPCDPVTSYEKTKLGMEQALLNEALETEVVILRPTAVFGAKGKNLLKLACETARGAIFLRYVRACLQDRRSMNLVSVENVVAALSYFALHPASHEREVFIVSDDEAPTNNYRDVEQALIRAFGLNDYPAPVLALPSWLQRSLRHMAGRSNPNTHRRYRCDKLLAAGFVKPVAFHAALEGYANYLAQQFRARATMPR